MRERVYRKEEKILSKLERCEVFFTAFYIYLIKRI